MKKKIALLSLAVAIILSANIKEAWAYFTTYARAEGGYVVHFGPDTEIEEDFSNWTKRVRIRNKRESQPVYIRARAFCGAEYSLIYSNESGRWSEGSDGYWYYRDILNPDSRTETLSIKIADIPKEEVENAAFNVVVIYESTPVRYDKDGRPYADWTSALDSVREEGGR